MKLSYQQIKELRSQYDDNVVLHLNKASIVKKCGFCGAYFCPTHHRQVYCTKDCSAKALQDQKNKWKREKWIRPKRTGTGYIDEKRKTDFKEEEKTIRKELRRLGLKR